MTDSSRRDAPSPRHFDNFDNLIDETLDGIYLIEADSARILDVNEAACVALGYTREALLALHVWQFSSAAQNIDRWREMLPAFIENQYQSFDDLHIHKDGHQIPVSIKARYIGRPDGRYFLAVARDISERKQTESRLKASETLLRTTLDSTADGILVIGPDGRVITANHRFQVIWDIPDELMGLGDDDKLLGHVLQQLDDPEGFIAEVERLYGTDEVTFETINFRDGRVLERYTEPLQLPIGLGRIWSFRDVTLRERAQRQLQEERSFLNTLIESIPDLVWLKDPNGVFLACNASYEKTVGLAKSAILGKTDFDLFTQEIAERFRAEDLNVIETRQVSRIENSFVDPRTHEPHWFDSTKSPMYRSDGSLIGVLGTAHDITMARKAEQNIREMDARRKALLDVSQDGIAIIDQQHRIIEANTRLCEMLGYDEQEILTLHTWDWEADLDEQQIREGFSDLSMIEKRFETRHRRKDGSVFDVEVSVSGRDFMGEPVVIAIVRDISERKDKELELARYREDLELLVDQRTQDIAKQKTAFETLFEKSPNGELIIENGLFVQCNEKVVEILGYTNKQQFLPCTPIQLSPRYQPDGRLSQEKAPEMLAQALANNGHVFEWMHRRANGEDFWCEITLTPLSLPGRDDLLFAAWRDISEQKAVEESMQRARDLAEAATRQKSEFLANMSHEIRTPMNAIIGMTHLALQTGLSEKQHNYIAKAHQAGASLLGILNDILDFSKIEAGKLNLEQSLMRLDELMANLSGLMTFKAEEKGLRLALHIDSDVPNELLGDPLRIRQILINLTSNAIKFTPEGGEVDLCVALKERVGDSVAIHFSVTDTGIGLSPTQQQKLFQPFSQVDSSTTRQFGGTGLGLAISNQLVHKMGGQIRVSSRPERGSTFEFTLRLKLAPASPSRAKPQHADHANDENDQALSVLQGARVLLVEDNEINLELARELLSMSGLHTAVATNGQEALLMLEKQHFDGVLMDCQMPVMDGYEATRRIRADTRFANLPIIAMTANTMKGDREKVIEVGMNDHIAKPLDPDLMLKIMAKWIKPGT